ncbi:class I SAM-dependent methyltransferase [Trichothermofontia sichuanensis B231]|uniref:class I SAM-dependent methyltransferase n=1 Tax=Trichothermofontia sichuanensis TaxID=3045816 RepID=UPI002246F04A|nr:class I SAM-dependent methyltransferase [Trichothermofontia sichuanensis]UZQ55322.1 class I SAM-dependent methyltransferase [Trichothermofontia sichuanensis B231]
MIQAIKSKNIEYCPICSATGNQELTGCRDYICGLPGTWTFYRCQHCQSLWLNPRPIDEAIPLLYPENYHFTHGQPSYPLQEPSGQWAKFKFAVKLGILESAFGYQGLTQRASNKLATRIGKVLGKIPGQSGQAGYAVRFLHKPAGTPKLLEVGSGNGSFLWLMQELGWQVEGIEPDPYAAQASKMIGLNVKQGSVENAHLEPENYDAIVLHHVLEHLPNPKSTLLRLIEALRPKGVLVSISPNPVGILERLFKNNWYAADSPRHLVLPSPKGLRFIFNTANIDAKVSIRTTMQIAFWVYQESLSIQKYSKVGQYKSNFYLKFPALLFSKLPWLFPYSGEEVICIAIKSR